MEKTLLTINNVLDKEMDIKVIRFPGEVQGGLIRAFIRNKAIALKSLAMTHRPTIIASENKTLQSLVRVPKRRS